MGKDDPGPRLPAHLLPLFGDQLSERAKSALTRVLSGEAERLKTGRLGRAMELSKLAVKGGGKMLAAKAKGAVGGETSGAGMELALEMLETFSQMRGLTMKLGQMLSYLDDALPPEARKVLTLLQRDAPPMALSEVEAVLQQELGEKRALLLDLEDKPIGAASIGQVHRGRLADGTMVAVKVQYPGIDQAMQADLKNARIIGLMKGMLFFRTDAEAILRELEERFLDECNYLKEAEYQEAYRQRFVGHPHIVVPKVHRELSTRRVLVTTYYPGKSFYQWLEGNPDEAARNLVTRLFYRFYIGAFYLDGLFNCDPHPGNYLFMENGQVVFLDYGCARRYPSERLVEWVALCRATFEDDRPALHRLAVQMGFVAPETNYDKEAFRDLMRYLYLPYLTEGPYHFAAHGPQDTFRLMFTENPNLFKLNMPSDAVFLNRIGFGLVSLWTQIGSSLDCRKYASAYFEGLDPDWPEDPRRGQAACLSSPNPKT
ncbi:MAG: AarF/ABC1/UbiB kinase family protein [Deltaproteobacteria bacterium]|nr:AarF/ABC1/UbiB kinase family protein [Deltaproteobacteria bacterium]